MISAGFTSLDPLIREYKDVFLDVFLRCGVSLVYDDFSNQGFRGAH